MRCFVNELFVDEFDFFSISDKEQKELRVFLAQPDNLSTQVCIRGHFIYYLNIKSPDMV